MDKLNLAFAKELGFQSHEAIKVIRSNIQFSGHDKRVITISSSVQSEGKSTTSFQIAKSFAESGKKVLLVDADLRKSVFINRYRVQNGKFGLTNYLSGQVGLSDVVCQTNIDNLYMILAGPVPPNPAELLQTELMDQLIQEVRENYDYVFIDTPPVGFLVDGIIVAKKTDGIILVIASNHLSYKVVRKVVAQLKASECKLIGTILNRVNVKHNILYKKYYSGYYTK